MAPPHDYLPGKTEITTVPGQRPPGGGKPPAATAWKVIAASVAGRAHTTHDKGNEDAVLTDRRRDGTVLLALADGAGSAGLAGEGARLAVDAAIAALRRESIQGDRLDQALRAALKQVRKEVGAKARQLRVRPRDFACTLLLAVAREDTLAVLQVGDGAVIALGEEGWSRITQPQRGRYAGETTFVTSRGASALAEVEIRSLAPLRALALLSDGLEPVATDMTNGTPHGPFFDPLVTFAAADRPVAEQEAAISSFLASDRVQSRSSDDLSLILALKP
ncbi:MAG: PP2C family serine/threonine-protein phosphatase [Trueperaceae bacterium]